MKKNNLILLAALVVALASCQKGLDATIYAKYNLQGTIQTDSLREIISPTVSRFYNFSKDPKIHKLWMWDFWWGDAYGFNLPPVEYIGHAIRYTPPNPEIPDGEQVIVPFTWTTEADGTIIMKMGTNRAEVITDGWHVIIHQFKGPGLNEIERYYYGHKEAFGTNMNGNEVNRPG